MSTLGNAIFHLLKTDATVGPAVLVNGLYKIYPLTGYLEDEPPFITYQSISENANRTKSADAGPDVITMQINVVHTDYASARALAKAVRAALDLKSGTINGAQIQYISYQSQRDMWEDNARLNGVAMIAQDYTIRFLNAN